MLPITLPACNAPQVSERGTEAPSHPPTASAATQVDLPDLGSTTSLAGHALPAGFSSPPAFPAHSLAMQQAWQAHFQPLLADLKLLMHAHSHTAQQTQQQHWRWPSAPASGSSSGGAAARAGHAPLAACAAVGTLEWGSASPHRAPPTTTAPSIPAGEGLAGPCRPQAWSEHAPALLGFIAAELGAFLAKAESTPGELGATQQMLRQLALPSGALC